MVVFVSTEEDMILKPELGMDWAIPQIFCK